jgi:transcriptional antiterminator RfaH
MSEDREHASWIVASTHPRREHAAIANLSRQGFHAYCPRTNKRVRHARQTRNVLSPLFPGYVFIRLDPRVEPWRSIDSTTGIRNLVRFGDYPAVVPADFITGLRASEQDGVIPSRQEAYQPGQKVQMRDGPFDGVIATVLSCSAAERIVVLMELLKRDVKINLSVDEVTPV